MIDLFCRGVVAEGNEATLVLLVLSTWFPLRRPLGSFPHLSTSKSWKCSSAFGRTAIPSVWSSKTATWTTERPRDGDRRGWVALSQFGRGCFEAALFFRFFLGHQEVLGPTLRAPLAWLRSPNQKWFLLWLPPVSATGRPVPPKMRPAEVFFGVAA